MDQLPIARSPRILLAPLDWGLGHATRCIPLIKLLLDRGATVILAGETATQALLQAEFPNLTFIQLKGYRVRYSKKSWSLPLSLASQIPKIFSAIQYEREVLKLLVKDHQIDGIISDNRYGFYHPELPSVIITHQLRIRSGLGRVTDDVVQTLHYKLLSRFKSCWVPDFEEAPGLAGELSHPHQKPSIPLYYTGPLSRMEQGEKGRRHILILLSGPEPQRSLFEKMVIDALPGLNEKLVLVRGLPLGGPKLHLPANVEAYDHLPAEALNRFMLDAELVIARSGYSTVMDLAKLKKRSVLVPTPGQTEQQYLASELMRNRHALAVDQSKFRLKAAIDLARNFRYANFEEGISNPYSAIDDFLEACRRQV